MFSLSQMVSNAYLWHTKNKIRVLCYHRVNKSGDWFGVNTDIFDQQIKYLSKNFNLISIKDFLEILNKEISVEKALLLTFDDGYLDNYTDAYPILRKYSAPAIIFLTTDFIDGKMWIWHDMYRFIVNNARRKIANITMDGINVSFNLEKLKDRMNARKVIHDHCKKMSRVERLNFLHRLADNLQIRIPDQPTEECAPLSWNHVRELAKNGVDFGAHTCTHEILSRLDAVNVSNEIIRSKQRIGGELQKEINTFAYPNGLKEDFNEGVKNILREHGFYCGFTVLKGLNGPGTDRFELMRFSNPKDYDSYFINEISGLNILKEQIRELRIIGRFVSIGATSSNAPNYR